ncbi:MAG TPA: type IV secretory system conjugative DNA transfer family protein [Gemmatimonadaceae bacterium]|jgi:type IV secretion system protein VirD4|nr:type IV secretory system conjugative DNA transfer family protein [Gemmatimonadaceae bacterium]
MSASLLQHPPQMPRERPVLPMLGIAAVVGLVVGTHYVAHHWGNARALGLPLITVHRWAVYSPVQLIGWTVQFRHIPQAVPTLTRGWWVCGVVLCIVLIAELYITHRRRSPSLSVSHGSARWGMGESLRHTEGLILGRLNTRVLRYRGDGHLVTVAPTRSGKGVSVIIPNLLSYPGSVVVTDPKGENYAVTARRRRELGTTVYAFDPFDVVAGTAAYNPLDVIDATSPDVIDDARLLADMLVVVEGRETGEQAFWNEEARALLTGLILYTVAHEPTERRTLPHVRTLLTLPPTLWAELLTRMSASTAVNGLVARSAARILQKAEKERSGVISSAQAHTHFLDSPRMQRVLCDSTVDMGALKRERMSLFLILPPDRLETYQRWLRLMIATQLIHLVRTPGLPKRPVVFFLDEFAHLGRMQPVLRDITLVGGYGVSFWLFLQDLSQLKATYAEQWQTFLANADVLQTFGTNDWETADYLSKMTGDATIHAASENVSRGRSQGRHGSRQEGSALTQAERARRLLTPDEVRRLDAQRQLLFCKQSDPIMALKECYYQSPLYEGQYERNPLRGAA